MVISRRNKGCHRASMQRRALEAACSKTWKLHIPERPLQLPDLLFENPQCLSHQVCHQQSLWSCYAFACSNNEMEMKWIDLTSNPW